MSEILFKRVHKGGEIGQNVCSPFLENIDLMLRVGSPLPWSGRNAYEIQTMEDLLKTMSSINSDSNLNMEHVSSFRIRTATGTVLFPEAHLGEGGFGSVFKFSDMEDNLKCAVKFVVATERVQPVFAQSIFDLRHVINSSRSKASRMSSINQEVKRVQENLDCAIVKSVTFFLPTIKTSRLYVKEEPGSPLRQKAEKLIGKYFSIQIQVMEFSPATLSSDLLQFSDRPLFKDRGKTHHIRRILWSLNNTMHCMFMNGTVFPDCKVQNLAIQCDSDDKIILLDTDGILTLRTLGYSSKLSIPRIGFAGGPGNVPMATFAPDDFSRGRPYNEKEVCLLSLFTYLVTLIEILTFDRANDALFMIAENNLEDAFYDLDTVIESIEEDIQSSSSSETKVFLKLTGIIRKVFNEICGDEAAAMSMENPTADVLLVWKYAQDTAAEIRQVLGSAASVTTTSLFYLI